MKILSENESVPLFYLIVFIYNCVNEGWRVRVKRHSLKIKKSRSHFVNKRDENKIKNISVVDFFIQKLRLNDCDQ